MSLLEVKNLSIEFETDAGPLQASDQVSFSVEEGEILGVVGESGCGKSVSNMGLLKLIPQPPGKIKSGEAIFKGKDLLQMSSSELREVRGAEIGVIFQEPMTALSPLQKIGKQLAEALSYHKKLVKKDAKEEVKKWLHKVGIGDVDKRVKNYPFQFSGGMRQRVMIAGTLMLEPDLIIADEPTTALDVTIQAQIFDILKKMKADKTAVILITHDMGVVWEMCDRVIVMYASQVVEEGPVKEIFTNPQHPYTRGLMNAVPGVAEKGERLASIPGSVPSPLNYPKGCRFADRCPLADDSCRVKMPSLDVINDSHKVRCIKADKEVHNA